MKVRLFRRGNLNIDREFYQVLRLPRSQKALTRNDSKKELEIAKVENGNATKEAFLGAASDKRLIASDQATCYAAGLDYFCLF